MALKLRVIAGPLKGQEFNLSPGFGIGRSRGDVRISDPKVSSLHAFVVESQGRLVLTDNGSKNGIRLNGERVVEIVLKEKVQFQIGTHAFEVIKLASREKAKPAPAKPQTKLKSQVQASIDTESMTAEMKEGSEKAEFTMTHHPSASNVAAQVERQWNQVLAGFTDQVLAELKDHPRTLTPLVPAVRLTFVGGIQTETVWTLGYGPRRAGALSVDLPILEPNAPDICFEIIPTPEGVTFRTNHPTQVTMNGQSEKMTSLKEGDTIAVGETRIEIELIR